MIKKVKAFKNILRNIEFGEVFLLKDYGLSLEYLFEFHEGQLARFKLLDLSGVESCEI